jgi:hypothetical protein
MFSKLNIQKGLSILFLIVCLSTHLFSQTYVNREWQTNAGNPLFIQWSNSIFTQYTDYLITVGNTSVTGQGANIMLTKYDHDGSIMWSTDYNTSGIHNDYGVDLVEDSLGNLFVCGTTDNGGITNFDIVILKYNSSGALLWETTYNSSYGKNDIAVSIKLLYGNIYIGASSESSTTQYDFLTMKYTGAGVFEWASRYDFNSLNEFPVGIEIENDSSVAITGASASNSTNWDYTAVLYNLSGTQIDVQRDLASGSGYDQATNYTKDNYGNIYITGKGSTNGIDYDMKTIKLNSTFDIVWDTTYDRCGKEDQANAIKTDASGNVIVGGYATKSNNVKEAYAVKYDYNGAQLWEYSRTSDDETGDAFVESITINGSDETFLAIGIKGLNGTKDIAIVKLSTDGGVEWERKIHSLINEVPIGIEVDDDGAIYIKYVQDIGATASMYTVERYTEFTPGGAAMEDSNSHPYCLDNQLIVRFKTSALNASAIDDQLGGVMEFGDLSYYLNSTAEAEVRDALADICESGSPTSSLVSYCPLKLVKIFRTDKTTDSIAIGRLGNSVKIPDFWAVMVLVLPDGMNCIDAKERLQTIPNTVVYADLNLLCELFAGANDTYYSTNQHSLHAIDGSSFTDADINIEPAWEIMKNAGNTFDGGSELIKVGIIDNNFDWDHEDFGFDGIDPSTSKLNGWDFDLNMNIKDVIPQSILGGNHGTKVSGVIGALRNNGTTGIAGIAGGNNGVPMNKGVSLFGLKCMATDPASTPINIIYNAIYQSAKNGPSTNNYGVNIQNHSWGFYPNDPSSTSALVEQNISLLTDVLHFVNRLQVTVVASRGNKDQTWMSGTEKAYPACLDENWVLNVSGSGTDGNIANPSNSNADYKSLSGNGVDISAPSASLMMVTTHAESDYCGISACQFSGTSAAAPHATGVVALLMSLLNDQTGSFPYKNLAPEDCERILEMSADIDADQAGIFDSNSGFGRLDAGKALESVEPPTNTIYHFGTHPSSTASNTITSTSISTNDIIHLTENFFDGFSNWPKADYKVNTWKITDNMTYNLNINESFIASWPRHSMSNLLPLFDGSNNLSPRELIQMNSSNATSSNLEGFLYEVLNISTGAHMGWWPCNITDIATKVNFEITVLGKGAPTNTESIFIDNGNIELYPNPSKDMVNINVNSDKAESVSVTLIDAIGNVLLVDNVESHGRRKHALQYDIKQYSNGLYLFKIQVGNAIKTINFVKS